MNVNREEVPLPHKHSKHSKQVASSQLAIFLWSPGQSPNERPAVTSGDTFVCQNSNYLSTCDTIELQYRLLYKTKVALLYLLPKVFFPRP